MRKHIGMLILSTLLVVFPISSQTLESLNNAETAYNQGDYDSALRFFELTINGGIFNGEVFYNLGNVYYEQGNLGHALLNYRRALQFIPRDLDLNIQIARVRSLRSSLQTDTTQWLIFLEQVTESAVTITELSMSTFLLWIVFWMILAGYRLKSTWKMMLRMPLISSFVVLVSLMILLGARLYIHHYMPSAIVIADSSPVYSGPSISYFRQYDLLNASEIYIMEERNEWRKFVTPDNQQGWIQVEDIATIPIKS